MPQELVECPECGNTFDNRDSEICPACMREQDEWGSDAWGGMELYQD